MHIRELNIACIQLWASGEVKFRYWDKEVGSFLEALCTTPGFVSECGQISERSFHAHITLFGRVQFALVSKDHSTGEETQRSPFFFLEDIREFVTKQEEHRLVFDGVSFTISETTATALKGLREGTESFEWEKEVALPRLITQKAEVLRTSKFHDIRDSIDKLHEEKNTLVRERRYEEAANLRDKERELWNQIEMMMIDACKSKSTQEEKV